MSQNFGLISSSFIREKILRHPKKFLVFPFLLFSLTGCLENLFPPKGKEAEMIVTGYCPCKKCCGWKRNWFGRPVYAYGKSKGKPKRIGICADGTKALKGTIAADTKYYPFGTKMYVPGYGYGTVHDRGGKIKGPGRIDIFFRTHKQALAWGTQKKTIIVVKN